MAAPLPTGSSLQALPVSPSINTLLGVNNVDPMANMSQGIDFAGQFARLGQLNDKLAVEDAQRKADAAKAKAIQAEAELMHKNLSTKFAVEQAANENALKQQAIAATQLGALQNVVVGAPGAPGTAAIDANTAGLQSQTNNYLASLYKQSISDSLAPGNPVSPAKLAGTVANGAVAVPIVPGTVDAFYEPNAAVPLDAYRTAIQQRLVMRKILSKESPIVTPKEVDEQAGLVTKPETFVGKDNRTYGVDVTYGPGGVRFARSTPVPRDISPERKSELDRAPELADTNQALAAVQATIDAITKYSASNAGGPLQTAGQALATAAPTGVFGSLKRVAGQGMLSPETQAAAAQLDALKGVFESSNRTSELRGFSPNVPAAVDLANPGAVLAKLNALKTAVQARAATLSSNAASTAVAGAAGKAPTTNGDVRVNPSTGVRYRFDAASNQWIPL